MTYTPLPPPQYPPGYYAPAPKRPALTRRLKRSAVGAGVVGFGLISLGWSLASLAVVVGIFAGLLTWLFGTSGYYGSGNLFSGDDAVTWIVALVGAAVLGILLWLGGLFASRAILGRAGHPRPWAVTWSALGIAIGASWVVSTIGSFLAQFASALLPAIALGGGGGGGLYDPTGGPADIVPWLLSLGAIWVIVLLLGIASTIVIGWLSWWWMAHAFRPASLPPEPTPAPHRF